MTRGTKRFLLSKTLEMLLTLLVVTVLSFLLVRLSPVEPAEAYARRSFAAFSYDEADMAALRARMGLDQPLIIHYGTWVMDALHLDFGESFVSGQPVFEKVTTAIGITVRIVLLSGVLQAVGILALGPLLYVARGRFSGRLLHFLCIAGVSISSFFFASSYLDLFAVKFGFTSVVGSTGLVRYLLADEPTSALDAANREQLLALFEAYRAHAAILLVSHDTVCLRSLCAEIVVMEQGRISERQETSALFAAPQTDWTKRFVQAAQAQEKGVSTWKVWS